MYPLSECRQGLFEKKPAATRRSNRARPNLLVFRDDDL
jgi:hypothetical protein